MPVINKFYLLSVIFSGSPDLTLKTCLVEIKAQWTEHQYTECPTRLLVARCLGAYRLSIRSRCRARRYDKEEICITTRICVILENVQKTLYVLVTVHRNKFLFNKTNRSNNFSKFIFVKELYMFRAVPLPIIRSSPL